MPTIRPPDLPQAAEDGSFVGPAGRNQFEAAFRTLFEERFAMLYRYLHRVTGDSALADDVAQDSFCRLHERGVMPDNPSAWLVSVANNQVRDARRSTGRRRLLLERQALPEDAVDSRPDPLAQMESAERIRAVRQVLGGMTSREQQLLGLRHEGYSYREIADALGLPVTSVGTLLARATAAFAASYGREHHASS